MSRRLRHCQPLRLLTTTAAAIFFETTRGEEKLTLYP